MDGVAKPMQAVMPNGLQLMAISSLKASSLTSTVYWLAYAITPSSLHCSRGLACTTESLVRLVRALRVEV